MKIPARSAALAIAFLGASCASFASTVQSQASGQAEQIFDAYQALEHSFDPALADLYCDTALIRNVRTYPDGQKRTLELPAAKYKELIRAVMPLAEARGDYSTYTDAKYVPEARNVRITAVRHSLLKNYSSPISLLVGSCNDGDWAILEELGESQP